MFCTSSFVCTFTKNFNAPVRLRSYTTDDSIDSIDTAGCAIWEAARATSAAAKFFDPIRIGMQEYVDGATGYNNAVELVVEEAREIWPHDLVPRVQCIVSIGTGVTELRSFGDNLKQVVYTLKSIATETEKTEERFFKSHRYLGFGGRYFRFNVDRGLAGIELDEHEKKDKIVAATELYLNDPRVKQSATEFVSARHLQNGELSKMV